MEKQFNPTTIYVLSVISFLCCCIGGLGIILAAPAFIMANNKMKEANANPNEFNEATFKAIKTARTVAMIALIINAAYLVYSVYWYSTNWDVFMEEYNRALEQYQK